MTPEAYTQLAEGYQMKISVIGKELIAGRVLFGPKQTSVGYARIVALKDGSGCIECFDKVTGTWSAAPPSLTFNEVWTAATVTAPDILAHIGGKS